MTRGSLVGALLVGYVLVVLTLVARAWILNRRTRRAKHAAWVKRQGLVPVTTVVVAGNFREASEWARAQGLAGFGRSRHLVYADPGAPERLRGLSHVRVVRVGSWRERADLSRVIEVLSTTPDAHGVEELTEEWWR